MRFMANQYYTHLYEAPFKTKCHQCFRNLYRTSNIYISDIQYIYRTSNIYIRHPDTYIRHPGTYIRHPGTYIRHPGTYIQHPGIYIRHPGTYIRRPIYILDIRYLYPTSDIQYPTSARARARAGISDVRYR